jgi:hypothetical protein
MGPLIIGKSRLGVNMKYQGSCHCEKIKFEVEMQLENVIACNCSICSKRGHLLAFAPEENFNLLCGEEYLKDYQFNKKVIHHYFCGTCGVGAFGAGKGPNGQPMRAINVRCLEGVNIEDIKVIPFDGRSR